MRNAFLGVLLAVMLALPLTASASTCPSGQKWDGTKCVVPQGGAPLFRLPTVYHGGYFNSPAPQFGHTVWFSSNQFTVGTLHLTRGNETVVLKDNSMLPVNYFNINHIPNGVWVARGCVESYMGTKCGASFFVNKY